MPKSVKSVFSFIVLSLFLIVSIFFNIIKMNDIKDLIELSLNISSIILAFSLTGLSILGNIENERHKLKNLDIYKRFYNNYLNIIRMALLIFILSFFLKLFEESLHSFLAIIISNKYMDSLLKILYAIPPSLVLSLDILMLKKLAKCIYTLINILEKE
jgi:hypothetical protein